LFFEPTLAPTGYREEDIILPSIQDQWV